MSDTNDLELRILNGLHRGASLPLDDQPQLIGAGDDADVVLVDPGIEPRHAVLRLAGSSWSLLALDGIVRGAADDVPADQPQLAPGDCARVGRIWLTVAAPGMPWQDPPADPPPQAAMPEQEQAGVEEPLQAEEAEPVAPPDVAEPVPARVQKPRRRRSRIVMLPVALGAGLVAAAAYAYTARSGEPMPAPATTSLKPAAALPKAAQPPSPQALREAFRQRLAEVDLLRRFDLTLEDRSWTLRASLDEEEAARFRRILDAFVAAHHIDFPIDARIGGADTMLPFKVRQVVSGANASIVTDDGQRLFPGDDYKGVRLVAINGNRISFNGRQPIEVKW
ncbi:FHA domain-containing protein [Pseudoduganella chitinolytica]|uniref:FHA domain-containing protein n=1 Tax=Pseudoduganella chitinolytica TaxID=34070 RepID=A0ABY8B8J8_9BURK|nr:FHA domain-containing protein [Pseudoduganella chitinolytica]WEF32225.1 FHA domain-containing protein [Pseudoduganella chitinolytica]